MNNQPIYLAAIKSTEKSLRIFQGLTQKHPKLKGDADVLISSLFGVNLCLDLNSGLVLALSTRDEERRGFLWRAIALTLFEGLNQYVRFVMPALRRFIEERIGDETLLDRHKRCAKQFSRLEADSSPYLKAIRNNCIAHREINYQEFSRVRASVNEIKIMNNLTDFFELQSESQQILSAAIAQATTQMRTQGL